MTFAKAAEGQFQTLYLNIELRRNGPSLQHETLRTL